MPLIGDAEKLATDMAYQEISIEPKLSDERNLTCLKHL